MRNIDTDDRVYGVKWALESCIRGTCGDRCDANATASMEESPGQKKKQLGAAKRYVLPNAFKSQL